MIARRMARALCLSAALAAWSCLSLAACDASPREDEPACGDGILQVDRGEQCDDGPRNSDEGPCRVDCTLSSSCGVQMDLACLDAECGAVEAVDTCGQRTAVSCGACAGAGEICFGNRCVERCDLSDGEVAEICRDKCGAIQAPDVCGKDAAVDCGRHCAQGLRCNQAINACVDPSQCEIDTAPHCAQSRCGAASAIDGCGEEIFFDCAGMAGVEVDNPLRDLSEIDGWFVGPTGLWDEAGAQRFGAIEQGNVLMYLIYSAALGAGAIGRLSAVPVTGERLGACETEFCAIVLKQADGLDYWYDSVSGTATVLSLDPLQIEFSDVYFLEYADALDGRHCLTSPVDFKYAYGVICDRQGLAAHDAVSFGKVAGGHSREAPLHYAIGGRAFDYDQVVYYYSDENTFIYIDINNFWRNLSALAEGIPLNVPIDIDTIGGFTGDGYPYCHSQSCLMIYAGAQYNAFRGAIEISARDPKKGVAGTVSNAEFFMADATTVAPHECLTPAISFSFETSPGSYTDDLGQQQTYFTSNAESHSWQDSCARPIFQTPSAWAPLEGKVFVLARPEQEGWSELEFWSEALADAGSRWLVNVNTYFERAFPFTEGLLETFENYQLHPLTSDWRINDGVPYCYSPVCVGYVHGATLYSPVSGSVSIASIDARLSGSASQLVLTDSEAQDESGAPIVCLHAPVSFSFSAEVPPETPPAHQRNRSGNSRGESEVSSPGRSGAAVL